MPHWPTPPYPDTVQAIEHAVEHLWVHIDTLADDQSRADAALAHTTAANDIRLAHLIEQLRQTVGNGIAALRTEIRAMSATVQQVTDQVTAVRADIGLLATDLTSIASRIAALEAAITAGSPDLDALLADVSSLRVAADAAVATATGMATPAEPAPVTV